MKIIAILNMRLASSRLKKKLLKPFGNTTLAEIAIKKLSNLKLLDEKYMAAYEKKLLDIGYKYLPKKSVITRSRKSAYSQNNLFLEWEYLKKIDFDYCIWINSCHAHLKKSTIEKAIKEIRTNKHPALTSVIRHYSWFYKINGKNPINNLNPKSQKNTQDSFPIYEVAHAFHIFNRKQFFSKGVIWNNKKNDPYLFEISKIESLDVDDLDDFKISESVYKNNIRT